MRNRNDRRGFTLVEMLVVIAIIAILISIVIPTVTAGTVRAKAATDAANLRSILGAANIEIFGKNETSALENLAANPIYSKLDPDAVMMIYYKLPAFQGIYFVNRKANPTKCYSLDYLSEVAEKGSSEVSTALPKETGYYWMIVGGDSEQIDMTDINSK